MILPLLIAGAVAGLGAAAYGMSEEMKPKFDPYEVDMDKFKYKKDKINYNQMSGDAQNRTFSGSAQDQWRRDQRGIGDMLRAQAAGTAPSAAQMQMQQGMERNQAGARALAATQTGVSPAMALRSAQEANTQGNITTMQNMAQLRAQEQAQAQQAYGQFVQGAREQDQSMIGLGLQQGQQNDQMTQYYMTQGFNREQAQMQANQAAEQLRQKAWMDEYSLRTGIAKNQQDFMTSLAGAGSSAAGGMMSAGAMAASDRRAKKEIKKTKKELDHFMDTLSTYSYKYKDKSDGKGKHVSVMAQDLEKTNLGKQMVKPDHSGKKIVDYGQGFAAMLGSIVRLNERVKKVEGK